jgi:oligopeptide/dipeptide ABC transporter ATP-binding protein
VTKAFPVSTGFRKKSYLSAVDGVSFSVDAGTTMGIVGESGCGKSTLARLILGLVEADSGEIRMEQQVVDWRNGAGRKQLRRNMQMVFQNPYSSLNPRSSIGEILAFPMRAHGATRAEIAERAGMLLEQVGLHANHASYYPHQLSGGQRQRVNIARALALHPKLVICDEAVAALDKSVQAQVLNLLQDLQTAHGLTYLFISHDLNVVEYMSDRVSVMYLAQVVETADADELYRRPLHPYSQALLAASPRLDPDQRVDDATVDGDLPSPLNPPSGCRFRTRCPYAMDVCSEERPPLLQLDSRHRVACHLYAQDASTPQPTTQMEVPA